MINTKKKWQINLNNLFLYRFFDLCTQRWPPIIRCLGLSKLNESSDGLERIVWRRVFQKYFYLFSLISSLAIVQTEPNSIPVSSEKKIFECSSKVSIYLEMSSLLFARLFSSLFLKENKRQEKDFLTPVVHKS